MPSVPIQRRFERVYETVLAEIGQRSVDQDFINPRKGTIARLRPPRFALPSGEGLGRGISFDLLAPLCGELPRARINCLGSCSARCSCRSDSCTFA